MPPSPRVASSFPRPPSTLGSTTPSIFPPGKSIHNIDSREKPLVLAVGEEFKWHSILVAPFASSTEIDSARNVIWDRIALAHRHFEPQTEIIQGASDRAHAYASTNLSLRMKNIR